MKSWKFKLGIVGVFALGVIVGAVGTGMGFHYRYAGYGFGSFRPDQAVQHIMGRLSRELNLSDEQRRDIEPIVLDSFTKMRALRNRLTPEVAVLIEQSTALMKPHLTPEQQKRLDVHNSDVMEKWKQYAGPGMPIPPPPMMGPPAPK
jgi:hypothetical protein